MLVFDQNVNRHNQNDACALPLSAITTFIHSFAKCEFPTKKSSLNVALRYSRRQLIFFLFSCLAAYRGRESEDKLTKVDIATRRRRRIMGPGRFRNQNLSPLTSRFPSFFSVCNNHDNASSAVLFRQRTKAPQVQRLIHKIMKFPCTMQLCMIQVFTAKNFFVFRFSEILNAVTHT